MRDFISEDEGSVPGLDDLIQRSEEMSLFSPAQARRLEATEKPRLVNVDADSPYAIYQYEENGILYTTVDIFTIPLPQNFFRTEVCDDRKTITLKMKLPTSFFHIERLNEMMPTDQNFNMNSHQATEFKRNADLIRNSFEDPDEIFSNAQRIELPVEVDVTTLAWEVCYIRDSQFAEQSKYEDPCYCVVAITVEEARRRETRTRASTHRILGVGGQRQNPRFRAADLAAVREMYRAELMQELRAEIYQDIQNENENPQLGDN